MDKIPFRYKRVHFLSAVARQVHYHPSVAKPTARYVLPNLSSRTNVRSDWPQLEPCPPLQHLTKPLIQRTSGIKSKTPLKRRKASRVHFKTSSYTLRQNPISFLLTSQATCALVMMYVYLVMPRSTESDCLRLRQTLILWESQRLLQQMLESKSSDVSRLSIS